MLASRRGISLAIFCLITLGTLAGLWACYLRFHVETRNRRVEIGIEWQEAVELSEASHQPLSETLKRLQQVGATTLIVSEETLGGLEAAGELEIHLASLPENAVYTQVKVLRPETFKRIQAALKMRGLLDPKNITDPTYKIPENSTFFMGSAEGACISPIRYTHLRTLGLGLPPEPLRFAKEASLHIAGRISNFAGVTPNTANAVLKALRTQGAEVAIFMGEEALGYRGLEAEVADMFRDPEKQNPDAKFPPTGLSYGAVEFGKQKGDEKITVLLRGDYVRVHSIQLAEMGQMSEIEIVDRFIRAAKERNIRFCYVRLLTQAGTNPLDENVGYLRKITDGIANGVAISNTAMKLDTARRYPETGIPKWIFALIALGVAAGSVRLLLLVVPLGERESTLALGVLCLLCVGLASVMGETGRKLVALLAGVVYPAYACLLFLPPLLPQSLEGEEAAPLDNPYECLKRAALGLFIASAHTFVGIIAVAGILATRPFMVKTTQFMGIKAQHFLPIALVACIALVGGIAAPFEDAAAFRERVRERLRQLSGETLRFGMVIVAFLALVFVAFAVARTGNDAGVGVSGIEMRFRVIMERLFSVRPRTKEFLFGHPAFFLGLAFWWRGYRRIGIPLFVFGAVGQVSILNTFCHIHTPLLISFWRNILGLVLGAGVGAAAFLVLDFGRIYFSPPTPQEEEEAEALAESAGETL